MGKRRDLAEERVIQLTPNTKVSPTIKLLLMNGGRLLLLINALQTFGYR